MEEALRERARGRAQREDARRCTPIYTTDAQGRLAGVLSLRELLAAPAGAKISDIAWTEVVSV